MEKLFVLFIVFCDQKKNHSPGGGGGRLAKIITLNFIASICPIHDRLIKEAVYVLENIAAS